MEMDKYIFEPVRSIPSNGLPGGWFLVIFRPDFAPVHLGLISNERYYECSLWGNQTDLSWANHMKNEKVAKSSKLFLSIPNLSTSEQIHENLIQIIKRSPLPDGKAVTCLSPIRSLFDQYLVELSESEAFLAWQYITALARVGQIGSVYQENRTAKSFQFLRYEQKDLEARVKEMSELRDKLLRKDVYGRKYFSESTRAGRRGCSIQVGE